jgi:hypothetical protein
VAAPPTLHHENTGCYAKGSGAIEQSLNEKRKKKLK